ncbi:MAG: hypothetical protein IT381_17325 [Deltaproteobacteria bacterium]|nr:hypothetical protein [Deltaproteobacteria bacterium]
MGKRTISFEICDHLPPRKDGATSMWKKRSELPRLIALRRGARHAFGSQQPLSQPLSLSLELHIGPLNNRAIGDLDNFITGVCDGLQACSAGTALHGAWAAPEMRDINPQRAIGFLDDVLVVEISARKVVEVDDRAPWYRVSIRPN